MNHQDKNIKVEMFCLDELMDELYNYTKKELQNRGKSNVGVEIIKYADLEKCYVQTDSLRLRQIFTSLLDNAIKFTDMGYIFFGYHMSINNHFSFFVDDTGTGIYNDADLDLSIAQGLVQLLGGKMEIRPSEDAGISINFSIICQHFENF